MEIHRPKPWHGVRELLKEVGIIVIGVLIALGGEQTVLSLHRRVEVQEARASLHDEIGTDAAVAAYSIDDSRCFEARLDAYDAWARGGPRPPEHLLVLLGMNSSTWETVNAGAVTHMPLKERLGLARFYNGVSEHRALIGVKREVSLALGVLRAHSELDKDTAGRLLETVKRARLINAIHISSSGLVVADAAAVGVKPKPRTGWFPTMLALACGAAVPPSALASRPPWTSATPP